ncbi:acetate/propionate family kinase [Schlesneria paludicola]|uniref:acetate/propionate family kinase n=1 Tax=Schlesneria paludicola TaxID=360056 RepID=UPI00058D59A8|nr:acetate/propionate family kinase [Schlesneria paludicola]
MMRTILTINTGSSSLKVALYECEHEATRVLTGQVDRIGQVDGYQRISGSRCSLISEQQGYFSDYQAALNSILAGLRECRNSFTIDAVGHRVVHGGAEYREPELITPALLSNLERLVPMASQHLPQAIAAMRTTLDLFPDQPQLACFDTSFHRTMPAVAQTYPLPARYRDDGVLRYGFHGLSYQYIVCKLRQIAPDEVQGRVLIAHLGNGASLAAVRHGQSVDTTMGFTPTGGLMMGTRTGDLDPGLLAYLLTQRGLSPEELMTLINRQSGLIGVSETSSDMRHLLETARTDYRAADAVELFCYLARKQMGAMVAAMEGLDTLIFTGGIGEHAAAVRWQICAGLGFLGVKLDPLANQANAPVISTETGPVKVRVINTDEELVIARALLRYLEL